MTKSFLADAYVHLDSAFVTEYLWHLYMRGTEFKHAFYWLAEPIVGRTFSSSGLDCRSWIFRSLLWVTAKMRSASIRRNSAQPSGPPEVLQSHASYSSKSGQVGTPLAGVQWLPGPQI